MEYNSYSIQIKLHTLQLWEVGKAKYPCEEKTGCQIKFDRQNYFFLNSFGLHIFLIPVLNLCHVANFLAMDDMEQRCMQGDCEDISCQSFQFRGNLYYVSGVRSRRSQRRMMRQQSYRMSIWLCQLQAPRPFGRMKVLAEVLLDGAIIWTRFPNVQGSAVIAPSQGEIRRWTETETYKTETEMRSPHPSLAESIWRASPVFSLINGCGESEWALCLTLSSKQQYLS